MLRVHTFVAALILASSALAQEEVADEIDPVLEERIADQIERLRIDPRWVTFRAAWQRREESPLPPRSLEPLVRLAMQAAEAYNTLTAGIDGDHLGVIEQLPGLMLLATDDEVPTLSMAINWNDFLALAMDRGPEEEQRFFQLANDYPLLSPSENRAPACVYISSELASYREWRALQRELPHVFSNVVRQQVALLTQRLRMISSTSEEASSAIEAISTFLAEQPTDPLAYQLQVHLRALQSGRLPTQVQCEEPETWGSGIQPELAAPAVIRD